MFECVCVFMSVCVCSAELMESHICTCSQRKRERERVRASEREEKRERERERERESAREGKETREREMVHGVSGQWAVVTSVTATISVRLINPQY